MQLVSTRLNKEKLTAKPPKPLLNPASSSAVVTKSSDRLEYLPGVNGRVLKVNVKHQVQQRLLQQLQQPQLPRQVQLRHQNHAET